MLPKRANILKKKTLNNDPTLFFFFGGLIEVLREAALTHFTEVLFNKEHFLIEFGPNKTYLYFNKLFNVLRHSRHLLLAAAKCCIWITTDLRNFGYRNSK
jgi:hypothetical protein